MSSPAPSFLTEASNIAKDSINPVDPILPLSVGFMTFIVMLYLVSYIAETMQQQEAKYTYNAEGCQLDASGNLIVAPIYSSAKGQSHVVVGHNKCVTKTSPFAIWGVGFFIALVIGGFAGASLYKAQFYIANPKLAAGLYATDMLLGRR